MELEQGIPGRKVTSFPVSLRIPVADLMDVISDSSQQSVLLEIEGEVEYRNFTSGGKIKVQVRDSVVLIQ